MAYNIFTTFDPTKDVAAVGGTEVTTGMWSGDAGSLTAIYTSSVQVATSGEFYYDMHDSASADEVQFSVAYGHIASGSPSLANKNDSTLPTLVTYAQYRNVLLGKDVEKFSFDGVESNDIYVINIQRSRLRQAIDPGNWELGLSGSNGVFTLTDDSGLGTAVAGNLTANNVYNVKSGSIAAGTTGSTVYGLVFPDYGLMVLHPSAISTLVGFTGSYSTQYLSLPSATAPFIPFTGSAAITTYQYQHEGLVRSISGSMAAGKDFVARSAEVISSTNYFVRLRNTEFNYSNNPTYFTGSNPQTPLPAFTNKATSYVTTIGLYNDTNELLAVAKLSRPIQKSTDKEALIRVRLDY